MESSLAEVSTLPATSKTSAYLSLLDKTISSSPSPSLGDLSLFLSAVTDDSVSLVTSRQVVAALVKRLSDIKDAEIKKEAAERTLQTLQNRQTSFEEQIITLREMLADILESEEEWTAAARMLQGIPLESSSRTESEEHKLKIYVRIVRLLLEDDDTVSAQSYLSRAQNLIRNTNDQETILGFKLSQARIYDSQRKFPEAASKYHEISYVPEIDEGERLQMLSAAVTCAILSAAGPRRSRLLATLYRDERSSQLPQYSILSAMFLDRIIRPNEVAEFSGMLQPHQKAKLGPSTLVLMEDDEDDKDDSTDMQGVESGPNGTAVAGKKGPEDVLDKAVMEHNLLAASLIYSSITFSGLGKLLFLSRAAAEAMARTMIIQGRLKGATIDQVEGVITFDRSSERDEKAETGSSNVAAAAAAAALAGGEDQSDEVPISVLAPHTARWDNNIRRVAQLTEELAARCNALMTAGA